MSVELARSMESRRKLLEYALNRVAEAAYLVDQAGRFEYVNEGATRQLGYTRDEFLAMGVSDIDRDLSMASWSAHWLKLVEEGSITLGATHRRKDGGLVAVEVNANYIVFEERGYNLALVRDVTDHKRAEEEIRALNLRLEQRVRERTQELQVKEELLREARGLNENILLASAMGIAAYHLDGRCVLVNPAFGELIGGNAEQLLAQNFRQIGSWRLSGLRDAAERVLASGSMEELEIQLITTFGRNIWVRAQLSRFSSGGEGHLLLLLHDVTEKRRVLDTLANREREFRTLAQNVPDNIIRYDCAGRVIFLNRTTEHTLGLGAEEVLGKTPGEFAPDGRFAAVEQAVRRVADCGEGLTIEQILPNADGDVRYHSIQFVAESGPDGRPVSVLAVGRDLTAQKLAERELRLAATSFDAQEGIMITDADRVILRANQSFSEITGYSAEDLVGKTPSLLKSGRHDAGFYAAMWESINRTGSWQGEIWDRRKNGEIYPKWATITAVKDDDGVVTHYVSTHTDITERKAAEDEIKHLAFYDPLTRLPNRRLLLDRMNHALMASSRSQRQGALLFIDLDNFKMFNDTLGHERGDLLLQQVARRLSSCVRQEDTVARLGGDEFVVLLEDLSPVLIEAADRAEKIGEKILAALAQPYLLDSHEHVGSASIGVTVFGNRHAAQDELMRQADLAMYQAKAAGRNTLRFFDAAMQAAVTEHMELEMDLRLAVRENQFILHYQPQVDAEGRVTGAEALARWQHPTRGLVFPDDFIPLSEETGLILPLGNWVLETGCAQLAAWARQSETAELTLAINVSADQLRHAEFAEQVLAAVDRTGADPTKLRLELTESLMMVNVEDIITKMKALRAKGVGFALDDFGTGYSSLSYLKRLPLRTLKIDRSFVMDVLDDPNDAAIAVTIIALAHSLGLSVLAEGVETEEQRDFLARNGCHAYQGFLFGRPVPLTEFEQRVRRGWGAST